MLFQEASLRIGLHTWRITTSPKVSPSRNCAVASLETGWNRGRENKPEKTLETNPKGWASLSASPWGLIMEAFSSRSTSRQKQERHRAVSVIYSPQLQGGLWKPNALISHLRKLTVHSEAGKEEFGTTLPCAVPWRFPKLTSKPVSFTLLPLLHFLLSRRTNGSHGPGFNIFPGRRYPHSCPELQGETSARATQAQVVSRGYESVAIVTGRFVPLTPN